MIGAYADYAGMSGGGSGQNAFRFYSESRLELLVSSSSSTSSGVFTSSTSSSSARRRFKTRSSHSSAASTSSELGSSSCYPRDNVADVLWKAPPSYKTRKHRATAFRDFVLVTEFSEIEGPVPLLTIPEETKLDPKRMNDLAVRLMSTDYQSRAGSHSSVAPDAQVYQTNLLPNIHALANYVTLCDIRARGFVRPLCVAYVTGDDLKIPTVLDELRAKLVEASDMLKHTNRIWFEEELTALLADLRHTKEQYIKRQSSETDVCFGDEEAELLERINLESLASHISECELMLFGLEACVNDKKAKGKVEKWRKAVENGEIRFGGALVRILSACEGKPKARKPCLLAPSPVKRTFESIRPFHVLCEWGLLPAIEILHEVSLKFSASTQCLKFLKLEAFFGEKTVSEEFKVDLNIGLLGCLASHRPKHDLNGESAEFDQRCLCFVENWAASVLKRPFADVESRRTLTRAFDGFIDEGKSPGSEEICSLAEKYYVDVSPPTSFCSSASTTSSLSSPMGESPPVSQILSREEVLQLSTDNLPVYMENLNAGDAGWCLGTFFHLYSGVAYHVLFSLLSGRPVIIAGVQSSESTVVEIVRALEAFLPRRSRVLRWHTGIVSDFHVQSYQLIGLCVPERLCVQDMMCSATLNRVTVLNTDNQHIFGPAYSGTLLETLTHVRVKKAFASDRVVMSQIYAVLVNVARKVFLCFALTREGRLKVKEVLAALGLENCDRQIVRYLLEWSKN